MTAAVNLAHVNGVDIEYVEQGEGPPLVFVHGYISDHRVWDDQIRLFSRHHKVIAPSQRYFERGSGGTVASGFRRPHMWMTSPP